MTSLVKNKIITALNNIGINAPIDFVVGEPPEREMGDFATNIALIASKSVGKNPREFAEIIKVELLRDDDIEKVEIAGPGFLNISLKEEVYFLELKNILKKGSDYGKPENRPDKKVNVEYISANPTGPLHIGNARSGPIGKTIAGVFRYLGYDVTEEFYINDIGVQIGRFGRSLFYWYQVKSDASLQFPEEGYPGGYIKETSLKIQEDFGEQIDNLPDDEAKIDFFIEHGLGIMIENIKNDVSLLGIEFDVWKKESEISESGKSKQVIDTLTQKGFTATQEGAVWFKRPDDPELRDRESVLVKSDEKGSLTYFTNDIAYHMDKFDRAGKDGLLVDVWGANHDSHIPRIKAALRAMDYPAENLSVVLYQYVRLKKSGEALSMGKRLGNFVTLRQVIEAGVAPDAFKYFILAQNLNTPFDFDIDLAADTSEKNPVFYIKYAHARICSILRKANEEGIVLDFSNVRPELLQDKKERALYKELVKFPELLLTVSQDFRVQLLPHFAYRIASLFHDFYGSCKVISEDKELTKSRLALIQAAKIILCNTLLILAIEAPERM